MSRRGRTDLSGILLVDKPAGMTSHDVVAAVRRVTGEGRIGHAGTLDPMATGLLVVLVGPSTRLAPYLSAVSKRYSARIVFGSATDTDDAEGAVTRRAGIPESIADAQFAGAQVAGLIGEHLQVPPAVSAIKKDGVTAYDAARAGKPLELEARAVTVTSAELLEVATCTGIEGEPIVCWDVDVTVSKGTYVRAIARDLGEALGTAAHLGSLRRTRSGALDVADAIGLETLKATPVDEVRDLLCDPVDILEMPVALLSSEFAARASVGARIPVDAMASSVPEGALVALASDSGLIGVFQRTHEALVAKTVMPVASR